MSVTSTYREIFKREIELPCKDLIMIYSSKREKNTTYKPLSHHCHRTCLDFCNDNCHKNLGALMRKNLVFYAYGEDEVVAQFSNGLFGDLENAAKFAYRNRLPKRSPEQDGLPGEVLLDLLVQVLEPDAYKLAVRTIFRQDDKNEIKGYDLSYFTCAGGKTTLWLGQAKFGNKNYCKNGIHKDLLDKYNNIYLSKQIYFVAEKQSGTTKVAQELTGLINALNMTTIDKTEDERATALAVFFQEHNIEIKIPCLLAYGEGSVYSNISGVAAAIEDEIDGIKSYYRNRIYSFEAFVPEILFLVFPIKNLDKLRGEDGIYAGLHQPTANSNK